MNQRFRRQSQRAIGFTLVELVAVMSLVAILSITAIPAVGTIERARKNAAAKELSRRCSLARQRAMSIGERTGLAIDLKNDEAIMMRLASGQTIARPTTGYTGGVETPWSVASAYPGVRLESFRHGDGKTGDGVIWFLVDGSPQVRLADGSFAAFSQNATISMTGGLVVTIHRGTGAVEP